jgi:hypothetical protein
MPSKALNILDLVGKNKKNGKNCRRIDQITYFDYLA